MRDSTLLRRVVHLDPGAATMIIGEVEQILVLKKLFEMIQTTRVDFLSSFTVDPTLKRNSVSGKKLKIYLLFTNV